MRVDVPLDENTVLNLCTGDFIELDGTLIVARDAAHKRFLQALEMNEELPFDPKGAVIFHMGPTPTKPGRIIGSAGPTGSYRMDPFTPTMIQQGVRGFLGKGELSKNVKLAFEGHALYLTTIGGAAALLARHIKETEIIAYPELGPEAVLRLRVESLPAIVVYDAHGGDLYQLAQDRRTKQLS